MITELQQDAGWQPRSETGPTLAEIQALDAEFVMGTYARNNVLFVRGEGAYLWDSEGRKYLDFLAGIAVVGVGHCHPRLAHAIAEQARTLMHVSNLFHNPLQAKLAERLCLLCDMEKAFFCNSGAEANEGALKLARKWGKQKRGDDCYEIITFEGSFHGRTMGAVSATAQPKYQAPFLPLVPGFRYAPRNDFEAVESLVSQKTCAILIEPIQGESGVHVAKPEFLAALRTLCDEREILLIFDEVQCGMGRTGRFLGSQALGVQGDVVTLAKGIADGFPMGAFLARGDAAQTLAPGDHGSTFAGQPLACAAALATLDIIADESLLENAQEVGAHFQSQLFLLKKDFFKVFSEIRGFGLLVGTEFAIEIARPIFQRMLAAGIVVNPVGNRILRFAPPLTVTRAECDRVVSELGRALKAELYSEELKSSSG